MSYSKFVLNANVPFDPWSIPNRLSQEYDIYVETINDLYQEVMTPDIILLFHHPLYRDFVYSIREIQYAKYLGDVNYEETCQLDTYCHTVVQFKNWFMRKHDDGTVNVLTRQSATFDGYLGYDYTIIDTIINVNMQLASFLRAKEISTMLLNHLPQILIENIVYPYLLCQHENVFKI